MMIATAQPDLEPGNSRKVLPIMEPISFMAWVLVGTIVGWLVSKAIKSDFWLIFDTIVGMVGAVLGGYLFNVFGRSGDMSFNLWSIFVALVGAVVVLLLTRALRRTAQVMPPINNESP
jgi:uncharacterized membrane protein YeaQ/YmgE (transglycosylase-associated protein family)